MDSSEGDITTDDILRKDCYNHQRYTLEENLQVIFDILEEEIGEPISVREKMFQKKAKRVFANCISPGSDFEDIEGQVEVGSGLLVYENDSGENDIVKRFIDRMDDGGRHKYYDNLLLSVGDSELRIERVKL